MGFWNNLSVKSQEEIITAIILLIVGGILAKIGEAVIWPIASKVGKKIGDWIFPIIVALPLLRQIALKKYFSELEKRAIRLSNPWLPEEQRRLDERYIPVRLVKLDLLPHQVPFTPIEAGTNLEINDAVNRFRRMIIVGEPGIGKSTALQSIVLDVIRKRLMITRPVTKKWKKAISSVIKFTNDHQTLIPVWIELKNFAAQNKSLSEYINYSFENDFGFPSSKSFIRSYLLQGRVIFLFDALDEVGESKLKGVVASIREFYNQEYISKNLLVITCRIAAYNGELDFVTGNIVSIPQFRHNEIQNFLAKWPFHSPKSANELLQIMRQKPQIQVLAQNPLMLTIITVLYLRNYRLPESRASFYEICSKAFLEDWDQFRIGILRENKFEAHEKQRVLQEIALYKHQVSDEDFTEDEILHRIETSLLGMGRKSEEAKSILDEIVINSGLIIHAGAGRLKFAHLTFQEYFSALEIDKRYSFDYLMNSSNDGTDQRWREVILLFCAVSSKASRLIEYLLDIENIEFASFAVADAKEIPPTLANRTLDELHSALNQNPAPMMFEALAQIASKKQQWGKRAFSILKEYLGVNISTSAKVVVALAKVNTPEAAEVIVQALHEPGLKSVAINALSDLGDVALPSLQKAIENDNYVVSKAATQALINIGSVEAVRILVLTICHHPDSEIRHLAVISLGKIIANEPLTEQMLSYEPVLIPPDVNISGDIWPFAEYQSPISKVMSLAIKTIINNPSILSDENVSQIDARMFITTILEFQKDGMLSSDLNFEDTFSQSAIEFIHDFRNFNKLHKSWGSISLDIEKEDKFIDLGTTSKLLSVLLSFGGIFGLCALTYGFVEFLRKFILPYGLTCGVMLIPILWIIGALNMDAESKNTYKIIATVNAIIGIGTLVWLPLVLNIPNIARISIILIGIGIFTVWKEKFYFSRRNIWTKWLEQTKDGAEILARIKMNRGLSEVSPRHWTTSGSE